MLALNLGQQPIHLRLRLLRLYPRFEPPDPFQVVRPAIVRIALKGEWPPGIHRVAIAQWMIVVPRVLGARRHDADYGERLRVQCNTAPDNVRRGGELRAPQSVTQDHQAPVARQFVAFVEFTPALGCETEGPKRIRP